MKLERLITEQSTIVAKPKYPIVTLRHLGDRLAVIVSGKGNVRIDIEGPAKGQLNFSINGETRGAFVKLPQGKYTITVYADGQEVLVTEMEAYPYDRSSPLLPAIALGIAGLLAG